VRSVAEAVEQFCQFKEAGFRGVMMPGDVVDRVCDLLARPADLRAMGETLSKVYASHVGAADRMAADALDVAARATTTAAAV